MIENNPHQPHATCIRSKYIVRELYFSIVIINASIHTLAGYITSTAIVSYPSCLSVSQHHKPQQPIPHSTALNFLDLSLDPSRLTGLSNGYILATARAQLIYLPIEYTMIL